MDNAKVAAILDDIGTLLALKGENAFRCNAYHNAARAIEQLGGSLRERVQKGSLSEIKGIGETLRSKITELVTTGQLKFYDELLAETPAGLREMLKIAGLGPKKIKILHDELQISSVAELAAACQAGRIAALKGFGDKSQTKILEGIAQLATSSGRMLLAQAETLAEPVREFVVRQPGVFRVELCGSLRRRKETVADLDLLVSAEPEQARAVLQNFVQAPFAKSTVAHGPTKASILLDNGTQADLRVVTAAQFPFALHYFTGSKEHNVRVRQLAIDRGLKLNEYGLTGSGKDVACGSEAELFAALGLAPIPPELRENTGEIEAAAGQALPRLVDLRDLHGVFHNHTTASDGANSLREMAEAARELGWQYFGVGDHSQSLKVARGLSVERLRAQFAEIEKLNREMAPFRILKGTECDILPDGTLDYPDDLLAECDYVVASVHTAFTQSREVITERILKAVHHPAVTMIGHMTGRLLLKREPYAVDVSAVVAAAAATHTLIEINAHPSRLDLDWLRCKEAKALGARFVINPDAHAASELTLTRFGVDVARRGWLEPGDVVNCLTRDQLLPQLGRGKWTW